MTHSFTKMHGLGNDFVVMRSQGREPPGAGRIAELANRRTGIGFDQLLWLAPPRTPGGDVHYRIFNRDGSEAEQCGNGARCIARLIGGDGPCELVLEHPGGQSAARIEADGSVSVAIAVPEFEPAKIPFIAEQRADQYELDADGETVVASVLSMGNPHAVLMVDDVDSAPVAALGPRLERHARFPNRANIGFVQIVSPDQARLRVFERGAGETRGCGTGACAAVVAGQTLGRLENRVTVTLPGGQAIVQWDGPGEPVWLAGEAVAVFEGSIEL